MARQVYEKCAEYWLALSGRNRSKHGIKQSGVQNMDVKSNALASGQLAKGANLSGLEQYNIIDQKSAATLLTNFPCCFLKSKPSDPKEPAGNNWPDNPRSPKEWRLGKGIGIICGKPAADGWSTQGLDVDISHEGMAANMLAFIKPMIEKQTGAKLIRIGRAPRFLIPYKTKEPKAKVTSDSVFPINADGELDTRKEAKNQIEVLGIGQQFVAYQIHPDTNKPYTWTGVDEDAPQTLSDIAPAELVELTADDIDTILWAFKELSDLHGLQPKKPKPDQSKNQQAQGSTFSSNEKRSVPDLLKWIPNNDEDYDAWFNTLAAIKHEMGDTGRELAYGWSRQSANHEDGKFNKTWDSIKRTEGRTIGTLIYLARQNGMKGGPPAQSRFTAEQLARLTAEAETEASGPEFDLPPLPNELYQLPDGLGDIQEYIFNAMTYPCRHTAGWAAIATLAGFAQTNVTINSRRGLGFNEYYLTLAKTGFGKEELRDPLNTLITELDFDHTVSSDNLPAVESAAPSSKQGLHWIIESTKNHSVYIQSDEFAEWLKAASNESYKQQALAYLMEIYSRALRKIHPGRAVTNKYEDVENPRLTVFATTTAESVLRSLNLNNAEMGAYNRWVIYVAPESMPGKRYTGMNFKPSTEAVEAVAFVARLGTTKMTLTPCGLKEYMAQDKQHAEPIKFKDGLMGGRLSEQAIKLAGLFALSAKRVEINADDMKLAYKIRLGLYYRAGALVEQSGSISGSHETTKALDQVRTVLRKGKPVYLSKLKTHSRAYQALHINEQNAVIRTLIEQGDAEYVGDNRKMVVLKQ